MPQTNSGIRFTDIPGARSLKIVTMKLIAPDVVEMPRKIKPNVQKSMLRPGEYWPPVSGVYANQPPSGARPARKLAYRKMPDSRNTQ